MEAGVGVGVGVGGGSLHKMVSGSYMKGSPSVLPILPGD